MRFAVKIILILALSSCTSGNTFPYWHPELKVACDNHYVCYSESHERLAYIDGSVANDSHLINLHTGL